MKILGIETSCDETGAAVVEDGKTILSNIVATSLPLHAKTGGIIPEVAARQQLKFILPVIQKALEEAKIKIEQLDAIAVTYGPGLIGPLLVGVETAKTLSYVYNKSLIGVNHLFGHIYANWIGQAPEFPALALIVSGGHTDLVLMKNHQQIQWLGGTRDDAAGEAFDKVGRLLNLPYPAGPKIEELAKKGNPKKFNFPRPIISSDDFDFSFSGLKTAVLRKVQNLKKLDDPTIADICASVQQAISDVLTRKTLHATNKFRVKSILLGGGVAANTFIVDQLKTNLSALNFETKLLVPSKKLCTDNAAMIAAAAYYKSEQTDWQNLTANPQLYFD